MIGRKTFGTTLALVLAAASAAPAADSPAEFTGKAAARFVESERDGDGKVVGTSVLRLAGDCEAQLGDTLSITFSDVDTVGTSEDGGAEIVLDAPLEKAPRGRRVYVGTATATVTEPDGTTHEKRLRVVAHARGQGERARVFGRFFEIRPRPQQGEPRPVINELFGGHFRTRSVEAATPQAVEPQQP